MAYATKEARNAARRRWYAKPENKAKQREYHERWRAKHPEAAGRERENNRRWHQRNRDLKRERNRIWAAKNPEAVQKWMREHPEEVAAMRRRYRETNRERIAEQSRPGKKAWREANPERVREHHAKRRATKAGATIARVVPHEVFKRDGYICQLCGEPTVGKHPSPLSPSLDHIVPLSQGGAHSHENTQCAHLRCNQIKGARTPSALTGEAVQTTERAEI